MSVNCNKCFKMISLNVLICSIHLQNLGLKLQIWFNITREAKTPNSITTSHNQSKQFPDNLNMSRPGLVRVWTPVFVSTDSCTVACADADTLQFGDAFNAGSFLSRLFLLFIQQHWDNFSHVIYQPGRCHFLHPKPCLETCPCGASQSNCYQSQTYTIAPC